MRVQEKIDISGIREIKGRVRGLERGHDRDPGSYKSPYSFIYEMGLDKNPVDEIIETPFTVHVAPNF